MSGKQVIRMVLGFVVVLVLALGGIVRSRSVNDPAHWGETMGTGYSIKIAGAVKKSDLRVLHEEIESVLKEVNRQMSTWDPESEISRFNHSSSTEPFTCSPAFAEVVQQSLLLSASTGGAFDPTLQPLLNLWGFGSEADERRVPSGEELAAAQRRTGWQKIQTDGRSFLVKREPGLSLALGAIAKGYGVDQLAGLLETSGCENWFAEIGGEVAVHGMNPEGVPWRIGIQFPSTNPMEDQIQGILHLSDGAVATSGDYRNYLEEDGVIYSHILDPRTGLALRSDVASVTVVAPRCMDADGAATALFVMGADEGLRWVEQQPGLEALFLLRGEGNEIIEKFSSGFRKATAYTRAR
jgi:thiamine biosynthesis lipoprotein